MGLTYEDVILDGGNTDQVLSFNNVERPSSVHLINLSIVNGNAPQKSGGGIYSNQKMLIENCKISNNTARYGGGGLYIENSNIVILNTIISNNTTSGRGGGFNLDFLYPEPPVIINSNIINNIADGEGGGFYIRQYTDSIEITNSSISNNSGYNGGGFYSTSSATLTDSNISNNNATYRGGGFYVSEDVLVTNSRISDNNCTGSGGGGGFYTSKYTTIISSSILNNTASIGGGFIGGFVTLEFTNISNNISTRSGGGFYASYRTYINKSRLINNHSEWEGAACKINDYIQITNSLLANNTSNTGVILQTIERTPSFIINNNFINNEGYVATVGIIINNIFDANTDNILLEGDSKIYNNYLDYTKIDDNGYIAIKKNNLQPQVVGDIFLWFNNLTPKFNSPVINNGLDTDSTLFKDAINSDYHYANIIQALQKDIFDNNRTYNNETIDIGAAEYGYTELPKCPIGERIKQGMNKCIPGTKVLNPGIWLPSYTNSYAERLIQGTNTYKPVDGVQDPGIWLPEFSDCRLLQGTDTCL